VCRRGRWYVVGQDTDRTAERVFRLSRIEGPVRFTGPPGSVSVPPGADVRAAVHDWDSSAPRSCLLRVRAGTGYGLRRYAGGIEAAPEAGWDRGGPGSRDTTGGRKHTAGFGAAVGVLEPSALRDAVTGRLKGVLA